MMRNQLRSVAAITLVTIIIAAVSMQPIPVLAQGDPAAALPNVLVQVYSADPAAQAYYTVFTPEGQTAFNEVHEPNQAVYYAPDGSAKAIHTTPDTGIGIYEVLTPAGPVSFEGAIGYSSIAAKFSQDSKWFLYSQAQIDPKHWLLGMVEVATGKRLEFIGTYDITGALGDNRVGIPLDFDGARLWLVGVYPFTESNFGGLYAMPLPDLMPVEPGQYGMPNILTLLPGDNTVSYWELSPNGQQLALLSNDPANPPAAFQAFGPVPTSNTLKVVDLTQANDIVTAVAGTRTLAVAGPGQALGQVAWSPDSSRLFFTGGNFQNTSYLVLAEMYIVALSDAAVTPIGLSVTDPGTYISQMRACGNNLYAALSGDPSLPVGAQSTLVTSSLATPAAFNSLATGLGFFISGCTARS